MPEPVPVLIATYLEPEYVEQIAATDPRVAVMYEPDLLPTPRYRCDHGGPAPALDAAGQARWAAMLARTEVSFDFDWQAPADLPVRAPRLRWVQATSAGIGAFVQRTGLDRTELTLTTAAGIHAVPLAEFAVTGALYFVKGIPHLRRQQQAKVWRRYTTAQLAGRVVTIVGLGGIGRQAAAAFAGLGTHVIGVGRPGRDYGLPASAELRVLTELDEILPRTDVLVLSCPLTPQTEGLISAERLGLLPDGAIVVNLARGQVIDEQALIEELGSDRLGGACLDVFATEPLPAESPLWEMDNVLVSPHSASTVGTENAALTRLFCDNLRHYLAGEPLRNVYRRDAGY